MSVPMFHPALYVLLLASLSGGRAPAQALADWELQGRADGLARPDTPCQDFLQAIGRKPAGLEYVGCTQDDVYYIKPMQAIPRCRRPRRAGRRYLHATFGMPVLRYTCCGWSNGGPYTWREGADTVRYQIGMGVESLPHERAEWRRIEAFNVTVEVFRQSP